jgi:hypothetical protein
MMSCQNERIFSLEIDGGVSTRLALIALAQAAYRLAPPLSDEGDVHPDFRANDDLTIGEASEYLRGDGVIMLFAKGRMPLCHLQVIGRFGRNLQVKVAMLSDDAVDDRLFALADEILQELVPERGEADVIPFVCDPDRDLDERRFVAIAPLLQVAR